MRRWTRAIPGGSVSLDDATSKLVMRIYEGAVDQLAWEQAIASLVERTSSRFVLVATLDTIHRDFSHSQFHGNITGRTSDAFADYEAEYRRIDPTVDIAARRPHGRFIDTRALLRETDASTDPYMRWSVGVLESPSWQLAYSAPIDGLMFGISMHPAAGRAGHEAQEIALFRMIFDHMENAVRLAARPPLFTDTADAVILIDGSGRVALASEAADRIVARADGLVITHRRLRASARASGVALDRLLSATLRAGDTGRAGGSVSLPRPSGKRPLVLTVTPLLGREGPFAAFRPAAIVRIIDPDMGPPPAATARWRAAFGLTPAETRLVVELITGEGTLRQAADRLGIAYSTARVHLASIFAKAGVSSQAQLVQLLTKVGA